MKFVPILNDYGNLVDAISDVFNLALELKIKCDAYKEEKAKLAEVVKKSTP